MGNAPEGFTDAQWHHDALADTGDGYTEFHGWVLDCLWCDRSFRGRLQREATALINKHFDDLHAQLVVEQGAGR